MMKREEVNARRRVEGRPDITARKAMSLHAAHYKALPAGEVSALRAVATTARSSSERALATEVNELVASIEVKEQQSHEVGATSSMKVSQCVLQASSWERLNTLVSDMPNKSNLAKRVQEDACKCPPPLDEETFETCRLKHLLHSTSVVKACETLASICRGRRFFQKAVFGLYTSDGVFWVRTCLLFQSPMLMLCVPLTCLPSTDWPSHYKSQGLRGSGMYDFKHVWQYNFDDVIAHDLFSMSAVTDVVVVLETYVLPGRHIASYSDPLFLQTCLDNIAPEL
eukprot:6486511-Amphidinium_carterae.1